MTLVVLTSPTVWVDNADLSGSTNEASLDLAAAVLDATTFASGGWGANVAGLRSGKIDLKGYWDAGTANLPDDLNFANFGTGGSPLTVTPAGASVGTLAYFSSFMQPSYKQGGKVGDLLTFETPGTLDQPIVRGQVASLVAKTSTGTTASLNLGAVGATQRLWCNLHVLAVSGTGSPTLTATLQSDTATGFPAPTAVAVSAPFTAVGAQQIKGPVGVSANTWQRLSLVISGTAPSFLLYAAIGIA